jgi:release factor H-coupled RctB family protein
MSFWATGLPARKLKLDRLEKRIHGLEAPWDGDLAPWRERFGLEASLSDAGLGTIGGGNHFAELQVVDEVRDEKAFAALRLDKANAALLIHSGSRALGEDIFRELLERHGANPLEEGSEQAAHYLARHDHAMRFARANRALIAHRFAGELGCEARCVSDVAHNMVSCEEFEGAPAWFHRKGAASTREAESQGALMIPGSRGTPSYLVRATGNGEQAAWSLAHGAGRRWQRGYAKSRLSHKYRVEDLVRTELGGRVICEDRELLYDEAPQAYKDIAQVIADLEAAGLIETIAVYRPVLTYKVRRARDE